MIDLILGISIALFCSVIMTDSVIAASERVSELQLTAQETHLMDGVG